MIQLMTRREVEQMVRMSTSNLYRLMSLGQFPRPIRVGSGAVRWIQSEINEFLQTRMAQR